MAEDGAGAGGTATADPPAATEKKSRRYNLFTEHVIDLTGDPAEIVAKLQEIVGVNGKGEPLTEATTLVRLGRADETDPKKALEAVAQFRDLKGDIEVIADTARNVYKNVTSEVKRVVSIG